MIYVMRSVATTCAIQTPAAIDVTDAQDATISRTLLRFEIVYALAGVLPDLLSAFERNSCETTLTVDFRFADRDAWSEFHQMHCSSQYHPRQRMGQELNLSLDPIC